MDNFTIKPFKTSRWGRTIKNRESTNPKNYKFKYFLVKNLSKFKEVIFFNRVNLDIIFNVIIYRPKIAIITSYTSFTTFILLLLSPYLNTKISKGRGRLLGRKFQKTEIRFQN